MLELLQHWRLAVIVLLIVSSYLKGCSDERTRHEETMATYKRLADEQEKRSKARTAELKKIQAEIGAKHEAELSARSDRYAALYDRWKQLHDYPSVVPGGAASPGEPVPARGKQCFDADRLDTRLAEDLRRYRESVQAALVGLSEVVQRGEDGLADSVWWGRWATKIQACKVTP